MPCPPLNAPRSPRSLEMCLHRGDKLDIRHYVKVKTVVGGTKADCLYVDGVVFRKNVVHKQMRFGVRVIHILELPPSTFVWFFWHRKSIDSPRILLLSCSIEHQRLHWTILWSASFSGIYIFVANFTLGSKTGSFRWTRWFSRRGNTSKSRCRAFDCLVD